MSKATTTYKFEEPAPINKKLTGCAAFGHFLWNSKAKEFCGRDGASWGKVSCFYALFYTILGAFFIGMLAFFATFCMSWEYPTYYGENSVMNQQGMGLGFGFSLNPGLGFRPQIDVEDNLISYDPNSYESKTSAFWFKQYFENLKNFLVTKCPQIEDRSKIIENCQDGKSYLSDFKSGKACDFDYKKIFAKTNCTEENSFGYASVNPCVLIKLNKIYSWEPRFDRPDQNKKITIKCMGETSVDIDNIKSIKYHSENNLHDTTAGYIDSKYYPFMSQKYYRQPFVMLELDITRNALTRVLCKAYASNIDNDDRRNLRGMTTFSLFIKV